MINLLDSNGGFVYRSFTVKDKPDVWTVIGTSSQVNHKNPLLCIDEFKSDKGNRFELKREILLQHFIDGKIIVIEDSLIKASSEKEKRIKKEK